MRKFVVAAAVAASALFAAAPASAQYYEQPRGYGYGYHDNYGQVRRLQARIDQLQRQINHFDRVRILSNREANRLRSQSRTVERNLRRYARNGLSGRERYSVERSIHNLEVRIHREARDGRRWR